MSGWRFGWPTMLALTWSALVTVGCFGAVSFVEYPSIKTTAEFIVVVRNILLMGAGAIALPVSLYTLWMKDTGFRADLRKTVREELERERREDEERRERESRRRRELFAPIVDFVRKNPGCTFLELQSAFPKRDKQEVKYAIEMADRDGLLDYDSDSFFPTDKGLDFLERAGPL